MSREPNILLDEGAQRSFITKDLADDLSTKLVYKQNISMSSFGATEHLLKRLEMTTVDIITVQGDKIPHGFLLLHILPLASSANTTQISITCPTSRV